VCRIRSQKVFLSDSNRS